MTLPTSVAASTAPFNPFAYADPDVLAARVLSLLPISQDGKPKAAAVAACADPGLRDSLRDFTEAALASLQCIGFGDGVFGGFEAVDGVMPVQLISFGHVLDGDNGGLLLVMASLELLSDEDPLGSMKLEIGAAYVPHEAPRHPSEPWPDECPEPTPLFEPCTLARFNAGDGEFHADLPLDALRAAFVRQAQAALSATRGVARAPLLASFQEHVLNAIER